jgi:uncharacterized protein (TIGR00369 family)
MRGAHPSADRLRLGVDELNAFLQAAFPATDPAAIGQVVSVRPGQVVVHLTSGDRSLRPGGIVSGPTLMGLADCAAYALVAAHVGDEKMAVTTSLSMHFMRAATPGTIVAEANLMRLGRRIVTMEVRLSTLGGPGVAAHATVAYALPG